MRKKTVSLAIAMVTATFLLTGCGNQMPDLTEDQVQMVGDFAAGLLMKYDASYRSRLVDLSEIEGPETQVPAQEDITPSKGSPETEESKGKMPPVDDTTVIFAGENEKVENNSVSLEECLGLPEGIALSYQGEQVTHSYEESDSLVLDATPGNQLLVLSFLIENQLQEEKTVDIISANPVFRVTVNGNVTKNTMMTLLLEDLSAFMGTIPGGESVPVILLVEIEDTLAEEVTSIALSVKCASSTAVIQLK